MNTVKSVLLGLALCASIARAGGSAPPLDGEALQQVAIGAATSAAPEVRAAVDVLVKAGFIKGPLFEALKPSLVASGAVVGAVDEKVAAQKGTDFAQKKYGARSRLDRVIRRNGLFVVFLTRVGSGDLNPTLTIGVVIDEHGQIVKDSMAQDEDQVLDFLFPSPSGLN